MKQRLQILLLLYLQDVTVVQQEYAGQLTSAGYRARMLELAGRYSCEIIELFMEAANENDDGPIGC